VHVNSEDVAGSRVHIRFGQSDSCNDSGATLLTNNLAQTIVQAAASPLCQGSGGSATSVKVIGNNVSGNNSRTLIFGSDVMGSGSAGLPPSLAVSNWGNLVIVGFWAEANNTSVQLYNLTSSGNVSLVQGESSPGITSDIGEFILNGFNGKLLHYAQIFNAGTGTLGDIRISNAANTLALYGDIFNCIGKASYWTYDGTGTAAIRGSWINSAGCGGAHTAFADQGAAITNAQIISLWAQERAAVPQANTSLPTGILDVQLENVRVDSASNGIDVTPGT